MKVKVLIDNMAGSEEFAFEHGLSLWIETDQKKILFDTGASSLFIENAKKMNIDLSEIDLAVLSHGHYDHGGGLAYFLQINKQAPIYLHPLAFNLYYSKGEHDFNYIGLNRALKDDKILRQRLKPTGEFYPIEADIDLFTNKSQDYPQPLANKNLWSASETGVKINDEFLHEQNLVIKDKEEYYLFSGCAHNGILNILDTFYSLYHTYPHKVFAGLHLYNRHEDISEPQERIAQLGKYFLDKNIQVYTFHCTGTKPYQALKDLMGDRITYLAAGDILP